MKFLIFLRLGGSRHARVEVEELGCQERSVLRFVSVFLQYTPEYHISETLTRGPEGSIT
jgi:hypothetical protein